MHLATLKVGQQRSTCRGLSWLLEEVATGVAQGRQAEDRAASCAARLEWVSLTCKGSKSSHVWLLMYISGLCLLDARLLSVCRSKAAHLLVNVAHGAVWLCCKGPLMALCAGGAAWAVAGLQSSRCTQEPQIRDRCAVKHCSEQHVVSQGKQMVRGPFSHNRPHNNWWWILSSILVTMLVAF